MDNVDPQPRRDVQLRSKVDSGNFEENVNVATACPPDFGAEGPCLVLIPKIVRKFFFGWNV